MCAPIHLTNLFIDHFRSTSNSDRQCHSDLALVPLAQLPVYSSTKAAQIIRGKEENGYKQSDIFRQLISRDRVDEEVRGLFSRAKELKFLN